MLHALDGKLFYSILKSFNYKFDLIMHLSKRNFVLQYKGSVLGIFWSLIFPLFQLVTLMFVFGKVIPLDIPDYPAFVFAALLPWNWFINSVNSANGVFIRNRDLVRRPDFAPHMLLISDALTNLLTFLMAFPILMGLLIFYDRGVALSWLLLPLLVLIQGTLIVGLGLIFAIWNIFYRDVGHLVSLGLTILFWVTPVFYMPKWVDKDYHFLLVWNPMAIMVQNYRAILFYGETPDGGALLIGSLLSAMVLGLGYLLYHRRMHSVIDAI